MVNPQQLLLSNKSDLLIILLSFSLNYMHNPGRDPQSSSIVEYAKQLGQPKVTTNGYSLIGCLQGFVRNISWKYGLQMASTVLWACNSRPSPHAKVTSTRSPRTNRPWNPSAILSWKFFQHSANSSMLRPGLEMPARKTHNDPGKRW